MTATLIPQGQPGDHGRFDRGSGCKVAEYLGDDLRGQAVGGDGAAPADPAQQRQRGAPERARGGVREPPGAV
jgi:hypothetical protein